MVSLKFDIIETRVCKKKCMVVGIYHPSSQSECEFFYKVRKSLDAQTMKSDNFIVITYFNAEENSYNVSNFMYLSYLF